jgi:hypothetical protein
MVCEVVKGPFGPMIVCGPRRPRKRCACGAVATLQCDWPVPGKASGTCDAWLCRRCARHVGADTDYCPAHEEKPLVKPTQSDFFDP